MNITKTTATFTRPADTTAYASGDLIANNTTAGSVVPMTFAITPFGFELYRIVIKHSNPVVTNASFRVHLYADSPTATNGDNGAWLTTSSNYFGYVDIAGTAQAFSDSESASGIYVNNALTMPMFMVVDPDGLVYGLIEARGAYTPASAETFTVTLLGKSYS